MCVCVCIHHIFNFVVIFFHKSIHNIQVKLPLSEAIFAHHRNKVVPFLLAFALQHKRLWLGSSELQHNFLLVQKVCLVLSGEKKGCKGVKSSCAGKTGKIVFKPGLLEKEALPAISS